MENPKIRFKGYTKDWEQRKLGELGTVQTCKRIFKDQTSEKGDIPFFKNGTIGLEPDSYISREMYEEFRRLYPYPEVGDTLISVVGSIGRTAEYTGKDEYFQDSNVVWLKTDGSINKKFLKISYQVIKWLIEGSTVKHLYNDNILRSEIVMPVSQIEQAKIAEFFEELDHLITLHQRKCEQTKKLKKYMLQKMFPQNGAKVPEIRFDGFTYDWEQRKLIDYLEVSSEKNRDNRFTKEDVLSVSGEYGIVNQIEFQGRSFAGASVSNYGVVENGDVVYTKSPLKSNPYGIIKTNKGIPGIVSTLYAVYKPKEITDSKFVQIYFELDSRMNSYMHPLVNKGAKNDMKVSAENALKGMVSFPKKDEQEMISLYFSTLDNLITLHQRKCDELKKMKKYMLQNMFI